MTSLGEQLRAARRVKGKSLEDISNDTNISKRYLEALEENNYDIFPSQVYVKGFLSAYAKCVGLDTEAVVEQYNKLMMFDKLLAEEMPETPAHRSGTQRVIRKRVFILTIAFVFIILCLVWLLWLRGL